MRAATRFALVILGAWLGVHLIGVRHAAAQVLVPEGTVWSYLDDGSDQNGVEIGRSNMPPGQIAFDSAATLGVFGDDETAFENSIARAPELRAGANVLAVEVHAPASFDLALALPPPTPSVLRGPYLQSGTPTSMIVRWRTDRPTEARVRYGPAPNELSNVITLLNDLKVDQHVVIQGLDPDTRYYYAVGTPDEDLAGGDADHFFATSPLPGAQRPIRIWAIGDSGECAQTVQGCIDAAAVRDAYLDFAAPEIADVWIMLGDNAYDNGTDLEYTEGLFEVYPSVLRNTVLWPVPGNHDFGTSDSASQTGPYYDSFTVPTQAEAGGVASGTEAYYSFDYGNVHFIALDSHDTDRSLGGEMYGWLEADLMAADADWVIAYWHHPPYTKGSHDSDNELDSQGRMKEMREIFLPLLESYGVDLHLTGHSHSYERSMHIDGHYGTSDTFDPLVHALDTGDGDPDPGGDGAYGKPTPGPGPGPNEGTVYSVVGSSSTNTGGLTTHPIMVAGINFEGSMVIELDGLTLDAFFLDQNGIIGDRFRIVKAPEPALSLLQITALAALAARARSIRRER